MYIYMFYNLFQRVNIRLSVIYFSINHSSNTFISMLDYSKICRKNLKKLIKNKVYFYYLS